MIDYRTLVLNLRGAGGLSARRIEAFTGVPEAKIYRMAKGSDYKATDSDMINLLDLHLDHCPHLHKKSLLSQ